MIQLTFKVDLSLLSWISSSSIWSEKGEFIKIPKNLPLWSEWLYSVLRLIFQLRLRSSFRLSSGRMEGVFFLELSGFDLTKARRTWCYYKGPIALPDFSRNRIKTFFFKVHIFWEGHKILRNLHLTFDWHYIGQK